jgi:acetyltransferase-like isoleucine patch superfamily enzyme
MRSLRALGKRLLKLIVRFVLGWRLRAKLLRLAGYTIGDDVFIGEDLIIVDTQYQTPQVFIGNRVTIAARVTLVTASGAPQSTEVYEIFGAELGPIIVEDGVWIGASVTILPNVRIGKCAVVGAGSIVTKDVPPCAVVVGVPARPIKRIDLDSKQVIPWEAE